MLFRRVLTPFLAISSMGVLIMSMPADAQERPLRRTVSVSATGTVGAAPDLANVSSGVVSEGATAREALDRNTAAMRSLIDGMKAIGLEGRDVQTIQFSVEPRYQTYKDGRPSTVSGYRVVNQVRVVQRSIDKLGETLDKMVGLGANQLGGVSFEVSKAETLRDEARRKAMENAHRRAELYATSVGMSLDRVISISEGGMSPGPRPLQGARMAMAEAVPIEPGESNLTVSVNVMWELK